MPPSPAMRCSPGRELKSENHKRGHSLESGILFREKDDDLALFSEMQSKEGDNFLLQSNDDFEDMFSTRLRYFSDCKLGLSIPARGENSDLLNADGDKNDYDWLLTPPDTPLFPSLDDETPPVNLAPRGRPRSQPISISRSSTMEKSYRSSRGSPSPNRLSPSPRSVQSTYLSRSRPSSAPNSSPPPKLRNPTPSRRQSPLPGKPSTSAPRSSTPTPQRMSTGSSSMVASSRVRGTSPVKTSRGNSASPIKAWQSNIPGFSSEAPPNLRTSLADRPASYVRGSSPASRNGSKSGRQSMSPTGSRSMSSSHSHERDHFSSHSKGSIASSGDDDVESLQSFPISVSSAPRSIGTFQNVRTMGFSKKPNRIVSQTSAPKRSIDLALRQMDQRKVPQNMFRPLLSSAPNSTFYSRKAAATNRSIVYRNSSAATSSNASTELGISGAHDTEESGQDPEEVTGACVMAPTSDVDAQMVVYNKDELNEDVKNKMHEPSSASHCGELDEHPTFGTEGHSQCDATMVIIADSEVLVGKGDIVDADKGSVVCSRCGCSFYVVDFTEQDQKLCLDCNNLEVLSTTTTLPKTLGEDPPGASSKLLDHEPFETFGPSRVLHESLEVKTSKPGEDHLEVIIKDGQLLDNSLAEPFLEKGKKSVLHHPEMDDLYITHEASHTEVRCQQAQHVGEYTNSKVEVPEGAGISILLKRSSSSKGHVFQGKTFTSSNLTCDDLSYIRDSTNSLRSSIGNGSMSTSSSTDLSSARNIETRLQRQPSGKKSDIENCRYDKHTKHQCSISSLSAASSHALQTSSLTTSSHEESSEISAVHVEKEIMEETCAEPQDQSLTSENRKGDLACIPEAECGSRTASEYSSNITNNNLEDAVYAPVSNFEESTSCGDGENFANNSSNVIDMEAFSALPETCTAEEDPMSNLCSDGIDVVEVQNENSVPVIAEMEIEKSHLDSPNSKSEAGSPNLRCSVDEMQDPAVHAAWSTDNGTSVQESDPSNHTHEESTVMLEGQGGTKARSLTLEEATDAILFCSSIVQNLAYEAADIAIERENSVPLEGSRPTVTIVGKPNANRQDPRAKTISRHTPKSQRARKQVEREERKPPPSKTENEENIDPSTTRIVGAPNTVDSLAPPKLESKCNCIIM